MNHSKRRNVDHPLYKWLERGDVVLADGAMGTVLHASGLSLDTCFDETNITDPVRVAEVHQAYVDAGAQIIETNTFGANRYKLAAYGLEERLDEINAEAVAIAKAAIAQSEREVLVAGSIGPLGVRIAPYGRIKLEQAFVAYREQAAALVDSGVDLLILETQYDLAEIQEAIRAVRSVTDLPIIATMTFTRDDRTLLGEGPEQVARSLVLSGADVIGANCSGGPSQLMRVLWRMRQAEPEAWYSIMPNAGWPERVSGRILYPANAAYFGDFAQALAGAGASIVGGCCGTTPEHIAAMRAALDDPAFIRSENHTVVSVVGSVDQEALIEDQSELGSKLSSKEFILTVEMRPPKGFSTHKMMAGAHVLAEAGVDFINVADSPMARMRMSPWAACQLIQQETGLETILHFPTRGRNLLRIQGDLLAAHALGVRNVFVVMGDPTAIGDYPEAMDNYDVVPSGLVKLISSGFNNGVDHAGDGIGDATSFVVGCALNLNAADRRREIRLLKKKIDAGADFALTQPVFSPGIVDEFVADFEDRYGSLDLPLLVGLLPLYNTRHAAFLHNEVPGILIPEKIQARLSSAGDEAPEEGILIAAEILANLRDKAQGAYIMPPFGRYEIAAELIGQYTVARSK
ncbi:MAG: bifunctional homocysteine S-methyltransferase/methylenetetrahydrofolate reductase [Anaerolineales bacterium]|nr:bifunctional homocysteine S-methyltransferase/methylenetetrahydrofolate reductase [Anaerolineales bacterium]